MSTKNPVRILKAEVARKIAAGEVIDRPAAIVRELMDNAIDSGADTITVEIAEGGIEKVRVVDNGTGLTKQDLASCAHPHATSKIQTEDDLLNLSTLGFRGEALASIAAVCRLSIISGGYKMRASITEDHIIEPFTPLEGAIVQAEGLFENIPARRQFLKRPASEAQMCRAMFIEKALPHTDRAFRFVQDSEIRLNLPKNQSLCERFVKAMDYKEKPEYFYEIKDKAMGTEPDWSFTIAIGEPGVFRNTKKDIFIFVNGRRIQEYSLVQAIEYGCQGFFPNGTFPVAVAFIKVKPSLIDFNIHPAKKEARFKDIAPLHHGISTAVKAFFSDYTNRTMKNEDTASSSSNFLKSLNPENLVDQILFDSSSKKNNVHEVKAFQNTSRPAFIAQSKTAAWNAYASKSSVIKTEPGRYSFSNASRTAPEELFVSEKQPSDFAQNKSQSEEIKTFMNKTILAYNKDNPDFNVNTKAYSNDEPQKIPPHTTATALGKATSSTAQSSTGVASDFKFIGSTLGTFLVAEQNNTLYIIDKHAAHERSLFDKIMSEGAKSQSLLLPYKIETESTADDEYLCSVQEELKKLGFVIEQKSSGNWEVCAINARWTGTESDLYHALLDTKVPPRDLLYKIAATTACKAAVKDGTVLEDAAAEQIARTALCLPDPHCPHGRPCYTTITREALFRLVRRID